MFLNIKTYQALLSVALLSYLARVHVLCTVFFGPLPRNFFYVQCFPGNAASTAQGEGFTWISQQFMFERPVTNYRVVARIVHFCYQWRHLSWMRLITDLEGLRSVCFRVVKLLLSTYYPISLEGKWDFEVVRFSVHYYYYYPISLEGKWDFEVVRFSVHYYYYPISLEGKWDFEVVRFSVHYYYPIPPIGEWDLVFVWFHLRYYYYYRCSSSS